VRSEEGLRRGRQEAAELKKALEIITSARRQKIRRSRPTSWTCAPLSRPAEATLLGALERRESRGSHNRSDYPDQTRR
jgi:succinate dehydrogenase / fumarate reductase, flavoprotein subunit